jgi:hypothetical protein
MFRQLPLARRFARLRLAGEAVAALTRAAISVRFRPFSEAVMSSSIPLPECHRSQANALEVAWAVKAAARRLPLRLVCFQQALAAQRMMRRRGVDARLHYGIALDRKDLAAHVWVEVDGRVVIGDGVDRPFARVATFP